MLNTFPAFLTYGFFAPTLLRIAVALVLIYLAYGHFKQRDAISRERFPVIGTAHWVAWLSIVVEAAIGLMLLAGYHTQIASIFAALIGLKQAFWHGKYPHYFILARGTALFMLVISLTLLVSGAGALAMDLPL